MAQEYPIAPDTFPGGDTLVAQVKQRLKDIQATGPYWNNLPPVTSKQRLKSAWRALRPKGFSN